MFSRAELVLNDGSRKPSWTFGPISIHPDYKRKGYGLKLLRHALGKARENGVGFLCMEGNIGFYKHAGFDLASKFGIHYHDMPQDEEVPFFLAQELIPGWLPDDLTLSLVESTDPDHYSCMYENADKSLGFVISCYKAHSGSALSISDMDDKRDHFTMRIKDYDVDCYVSKSEASDYIWHSADEKLFFSMNSDLPHETNVKIIENLKIVQ